MFGLRGRIRFHSKSGISAWSDVTANGPALVADPADPLATLAELERLSESRRYAGYFAYDLGRSFEELPSTTKDVLNLPLLAFVPVDAASESFTNVGLLQPDAGDGRLVSSTFTPPDYQSAVRRCLDYISAGDVFQINLSQQLQIRTEQSPTALFSYLQHVFPAEFGAVLAFDRSPAMTSSSQMAGTDIDSDSRMTPFAIVSNSPELFLRVTKLPDGRRKIVNRPIKGTRPNAPGMEAELLVSEKDKAELAMIVDLQRNDLGRICEIGSVVVTEPRAIETHPTVLHGVATIEGVLREDVSLVDILRATFPCGSITGCPKIRAMEIIEELEPVRRGAYCGAIGWIGDGEMELSVAIRTMTIRNGVAYVPVGGGIVADSVPADEYAETMTKATALLAALGVR